MPLATAHRTHIVAVVVLIVVVNVAIVEIDDPGVVGVVGISSARPVVVGLGPAFLFIYLSVPFSQKDLQNPIPQNYEYEFLHSHTK